MTTEYKWVDTTVMYTAMRKGWEKADGNDTFRSAGKRGMEVWMQREYEEPTKGGARPVFHLSPLKTEGSSIEYDPPTEAELTARLIKEHSKLRTKIDRLYLFLSRDDDGKVTDEEQDLLQEQFDGMVSYRVALGKRIAIHIVRV